jgi:hypothetical protein
VEDPTRHLVQQGLNIVPYALCLSARAVLPDSLHLTQLPVQKLLRSLFHTPVVVLPPPPHRHTEVELLGRVGSVPGNVGQAAFTEGQLVLFPKCTAGPGLVEVPKDRNYASHSRQSCLRVSHIVDMSDHGTLRQRADPPYAPPPDLVRNHHQCAIQGIGSP